jgi:hypothetical protein
MKRKNLPQENFAVILKPDVHDQPAKIPHMRFECGTYPCTLPRSLWPSATC